jgi:hypothetical protein
MRGTPFARISLNREILSLEIPSAMEFAEKRLYQWFIACIGECVHLARRKSDRNPVNFFALLRTRAAQGGNGQ